ncbi:glycosyltransferase family 2 protein [Leptolyngbya sp. AN03gr2]|uniref:glycosyltransferase family 2 protein n=1 Tax=unclassified Leptolyngbya TaxID=2650499 RepID=UPI003D31A8C2
MKNNPLVSIIIPNYNYGRFLSEAIDSALHQSYSNVEVVVVDDGSTDHSREIIANYGDRIVAVLKQNGGQASSFNAGFAASQGDIVCFVDADDVSMATKAERIVRVFQEHPSSHWCFHALKLVVKQSGEVLATTRAFPGLEQDYSAYCDFRSDLRRGRLPFYIPSTSALCFKRSLLEQIMPIPEVLGLIGDEDDAFLRHSAVAAAPGYYLNEPLTLQGIHGANPTSGRYYQPKLDGKEMMAARFTKHKFPEAANFADRVFSRGLSRFWKAELARKTRPQQREAFLELIEIYLSECSFLSKLRIFLMAVYQSRPWKREYSHRLSSSS